VLHQVLTHPQILAILAASGHGDTIAIVDSNYPAQSCRDRQVPLVNLNISHQLVPTPLIVQLVAQTIPIEQCIIPVPGLEVKSGVTRPVHVDITEAVIAIYPKVKIARISPEDFYALTTLPNLALMIVTGERSHYGSTALTVGYLPELQ